MKKNVIAIAILLGAGVAAATSSNAAVGTATNAATTTISGAASRGTGTAFSQQTADAGAVATGTAAGRARTHGPVSTGYAHVGGTAATSGTASSLSITTGNGRANGTANATANATSLAGAKYVSKSVNGFAVGGATSHTNNLVSTRSGPGRGYAAIGTNAATNSAYNAGATSSSGPSGSFAGSGGASSSLGGRPVFVNQSVGNASTHSNGGVTFGTAGTLTNAVAK